MKDQSRSGIRIEHFEGQGFDSGVRAYRASFPAKSLIGRVRSIQVEMGNNLLGSGSLVEIDSLIETGSPFASGVGTGS